MPGLHAQLTTAKLTNALDATETLLKLDPYMDQQTWPLTLTYTKISTLPVDLTAEQEDRVRIAAHGS